MALTPITLLANMQCEFPPIVITKGTLVVLAGYDVMGRAVITIQGVVVLVAPMYFRECGIPRQV